MIQLLRLLLITTIILPSAFAADRIVVVMNVENPVNTITPADLREFFLKRKTEWPDGKPIRFIDWDEGSPVRALFLDQVIKKSARELELYWIGEKLYRGNSAPIKVDSPEMVTNFVSRLVGAIGYVPEDYAIRSTKVKRIELPEGS